MLKAREVMTSHALTLTGDSTAVTAARTMAENNIGALPICGADGTLMGIITDRDLALRVVGENRQPESVVMTDIVAPTEVVTIGADDSVEEAVRTMKLHALRRLPVIDGTSVVGIISQADIALATSDRGTGDLVTAISEASSNN